MDKLQTEINVHWKAECDHLTQILKTILVRGMHSHELLLVITWGVMPEKHTVVPSPWQGLPLPTFVYGPAGVSAPLHSIALTLGS